MAVNTNKWLPRNLNAQRKFRTKNLTSRLMFTILALFTLVGFSLTPLKSGAFVTVKIGNASAVETTTAGAVTVYGGVAGSIDRCDGGVSSSRTCNNCKLKAAESVGGGDAQLLACNERRIHENLQLVIRVVSDATSGKPTITTADGNVVLPFSGPALLSKGKAATLKVKWSDVCSAVIRADRASGGSGMSACSSLNGNAAGTLRIGVSANGSGTLNAASDDQRSVAFVIRNVAGNTDSMAPSLAENCASAGSESQICYFEVAAGFKKAVVTSLLAPAGSSFPSLDAAYFRSVRFLWSEGGFENINLSSTHSDLTITSSGDSTFSITPRQISPLSNGKTYYFKNALVDVAGNIGLYSQAANDRDCTNNPNPSASDCRIVTPK